MINAYRKYALMLVVFIHVHIYFLTYMPVEVPWYLDKLYSGIFSFFHPASVLAAISGYVLFREYTFHSHEHIKVHVRDKYLKRVKSVFIPYFFWLTLFYLVNNLLIALSSRHNPGLLISGGEGISLSHYLRSFLWPELAVAKHLWYLNNLLILFIAAPAIALLNRHRFFMPALLLLVACYYHFTDHTDYVVKYRFVMFFLMGSYLGGNKDYIRLLTKNTLVSFVAVCALIGLNQLFYNYSGNLKFLHSINHLLVTIMLFLVSFAVISFVIKKGPTLYNRSGHFFLYIVHPFIISLICKSLFQSGLLKVDNYWLLSLLVIFFTAFVIGFTNMVYKCLHRLWPGLTHRVL